MAPRLLTTELFSQRLDVAGESFFSLSGESPPESRRIAVHEVNRCHEHVQHARVVKRFVDGANLPVQLQRIPPDQGLRGRDSQSDEVTGHGVPNVDDFAELSDRLPICFVICFA